ncbi:Sugar transferase involved in LPS biosynthesis (colanic, teichoic acid) [Actinopolyspora lacussalsi subsp. righensis]|uniref:Sugar transferase involved in LPS biosynthesis (Colanic, teichoic acid) n=1 Tax=Actinopolyspora righensis TaxID=995060 RepID=A0A1I6ZNV3_9ACTN|nr:sugar transferase [Actinopolyspora righensis]SFT64399.1 Sugar transferase involved in LPS biosynthesis (colanic, teichoic acid) [Actinopolyspora righensis]
MNWQPVRDRHRAVPAPRAAGPGETRRPGESEGLTGTLGTDSPLPASWTPSLLPRLFPAVDLLVLGAVAIVLRLPGPAALLYVPAVLLSLAVRGTQRLPLRSRISDDAGSLLTAAGLPLLVLFAWLPVSRVLLLGACSATALLFGRSVAVFVLRSARSRGRLLESVVIVGRNEVATELAHAMTRRSELGLRFVGFLDHPDAAEEVGRDVLARPEELTEVVRRHRVTRVVLCCTDERSPEITGVVRRCRSSTLDICVLPRMPGLGLAASRASLDEVWGIPLLPLRRGAHAPGGGFAKRTLDLLLAPVLSLLTLPVLLLLSIAVRCRNPAAFFRQERITAAGALTRVTKLRTVNATGHTEWTPTPGQCGKLGGWLRGNHLDELPQLWNVLRGGMSLVGPRPERPYYAMRFAAAIPSYSDRHRVVGGITGWAQVHGLHGDTSIVERARFDNQYIEYWSLWLDLVILVRTAGVVLTGLIGSRHNRQRGQ